MPKPIINGTLSPQRKSVKIRFDPTQGYTTTQEFESAGDNCIGLAKAFANSGANFDLESNPVKSRLVAVETRNVFGPVADVLERWELLGTQHQLDIKEHPAWATMTLDERVEVLGDVDRHLNAKKTAIQWGTSPHAFTTQDKFFQIMSRGATHFIKPQWVLRVCCNVPNTYQAFVDADGGVGQIYTTAQLGVPAGRLRSTIQSITAPPGDPYLLYGWLKVSYNEITAARNRVEVSNELWLGQWATILYS